MNGLELGVTARPLSLRTPGALPVLTQFGRFLLVGGFAAGLQYLILVLLVEFAHVAPVYASTVGFVLSAIANYLLNHRFTFRSNVPHATGALRFAVTATSGLAINAIVLALATSGLGWYYLVGQVAATATVLVWNYVVHRNWTYAAAGK
jgi:putative flippase GtrA